MIESKEEMRIRDDRKYFSFLNLSLIGSENMKG